MIIDCFTFFDELDLLEIRLNELKDIVDVFILTESPYTFTGIEKPLYFQENRERFEKFNIISTIYEPKAKYSPPVYEANQKQYNLDVGCNWGDTIIQGDCDEIPKADVVKKIIEEDYQPVLLSMDLFYYWMNCKYVGEEKLFKNSRIYKTDKRIKYNAKQNGRVERVYRNAGWHFSYLGDIQSKLAAWGHAPEYNKPPFNTVEHIEKCRQDGLDIINRKNMKFEFVKDTSYLPQYVLNNLDRFDKYIK